MTSKSVWSTLACSRISLAFLSSFKTRALSPRTFWNKILPGNGACPETCGIPMCMSPIRQEERDPIRAAGSTPKAGGIMARALEPSFPGASFYTLPTPASEVAEGFMDTILVNGGVYPSVRLPSKRVRFRILNGSQARFYHLNLYAESFSTPGEADVTAPGPTIYQVGTEGGFLPAVAVHPNGIPCPRDLKLDPTGQTANPDGPFN